MHPAATGRHAGETTIAYVSLGSNQGRRRENLTQAVRCLALEPGVFPCNLSKAYYTEPQGVKEQPWFVNRVLEVACSDVWTPGRFMRRLLSIEIRLGRKRTKRWGPRVIDLDLLLWGDAVCQTPDVEIPHPRMTERAFVLVPLLELQPDIRLPGGRSIQEMCNRLDFSMVRDTIIQA